MIAPLNSVSGCALRLLPPAIGAELAISLLVSSVKALAVRGIAVSKTAVTIRAERIAVAGVILPFLEPVAEAPLLFGRIVSAVTTRTAPVAAGTAPPVRKVSAITVTITPLPLYLARALYCASTFNCAGTLYSTGAFYLPTTIPITISAPIPIAASAIIAAVISVPLPAVVTPLSLDCG